MSRLENLLRRVNYQYFHEHGADEDDFEEIGPSFYDIPWHDIICLCVEHRMKDWSLDPLVAEGESHRLKGWIGIRMLIASGLSVLANTMIRFTRISGF